MSIRAAIVLAWLAVCAAPSFAGVQLAVTPPTQTVALGDTVVVTLQVPVTGSSFNGFDAVVSFDPAALTFLPTNPTSLQQGAYMTGACGNTFHVFTYVPGADSLSITDVLLCNALSLQGPGTVYTLKFLAGTTPQATNIRLRHATFFDAGLFVTPVSTSDGVVGIGVQLSAPPPPASGSAWVRPRSNPARGSLAFDLEAPAGPQSLAVLDTSGRRVRLLDEGASAPGRRSVEWDGRDAAGRAVPPGVYVVVLRAGGRTVSARFAWLR